MLRLGIDLGGTKTEGVVLDTSGREIERSRCPTPAAAGYDAVLANVVALVSRLETAAGQPCRIGIGTPGAVSDRTGKLKNSNTACLNGQPIHADLERLLARPVRIANDANCFALSEARDGAGRGAHVVFGVIAGTGVGGGIVVDRQVLAGRQHIAGEWGHNVLEPEGPACYCGKRGCVETFLSGPGLVRDYADGVPTNLSAVEIVARAANGEAKAATTLERYYDRFARALSVVINILDPDIIVLGGGMSSIDALYAVLPARLAAYVFSDESRAAIVRNVHGDSSGVRGAAQLWDE